MAFPVADTYAAPSGVAVIAGRWSGGQLLGTAALDSVSAGGSFSTTIPPSALTALVGDSLTDPSYELTTATWAGGIAGGALCPVVNLGVQGETIAQIGARVGTQLAAACASMGVSKLGRAFLRCGTNDARALSNWPAVSSAFGALVTTILAYVEHVVICAIPPITSPESNAAGKDTCVRSINNGLAAYAATNAATCIYLDGARYLRVGDVADGAGIAAYFVDGVHYGQAGLQRMGAAEGDQLAAELTSRGWSLSAPLVISNADSYPTTPQWAKNPAMVGSVASSGAWSGNTVTDVGVGSYGSGGGSMWIQPADVDDPNQTPWQMVAPTGGQSGAWTQVGVVAAGRAITAGDPARVEALVEVRFDALDLTNVRRLTFSARGTTTNNRFLLPDFWLGLGPQASTLLTKRVVMRSRLPRINGTTEAGLALLLALEYAATFSGASMGSFGFRNFSLRG